MKIKSLAPHTHGHSVLIPGVKGNAELSETGVFDHPDDAIAKQLIATGQWAEVSEEGEEDENGEETVTLKALLAKKFVSLQQMCREANLPEEQWIQFTKKSEIAQYLFGIFSAAEGTNEFEGE